MNPGYMASLLMIITLILLASGWKTIGLRGISHRGILLFFMGWLAGLFVTVPLNGVAINGTALLLAIVLFLIFQSIGELAGRVQLAASGLLVGSLGLAFQEVARVAPVVIVYSSGIDQAILLAGATCFLYRKPLQQIGALSIGLLLIDVWNAWLRVSPIIPTIGGANFQDAWWLSIVLARTVTVCWTYGASYGRTWVGKLADSWRGWRG